MTVKTNTKAGDGRQRSMGWVSQAAEAANSTQNRK